MNRFIAMTKNEKALPKKSYQSPTLATYGDLASMTKATGSSSKIADGGKGVNNKT
jgi:hypothetical protein